jgi:hypothetical protein
VPDADSGDGQPQADAEAHVEIEIVGKDRVHGAHAGVPALQDAVLERRGLAIMVMIMPIRPPITAQKGSTMPMNIRPRSSWIPVATAGRHIFGVAGQLDPGNRDQPDGLGEQQSGNRGQQDIDAAEQPAR